MTSPIIERMKSEVDTRDRIIHSQLTAITRLLKRNFRIANKAGERVGGRETKEDVAGRLRDIAIMAADDIDGCGIVFRTPDGRMWTVESTEVIEAGNREDVIVKLTSKT